MVQEDLEKNLKMIWKLREGFSNKMEKPETYGKYQNKKKDLFKLIAMRLNERKIYDLRSNEDGIKCSKTSSYGEWSSGKV